MILESGISYFGILSSLPPSSMLYNIDQNMQIFTTDPQSPKHQNAEIYRTFARLLKFFIFV